jgi:hypothetical protein
LRKRKLVTCSRVRVAAIYLFCLFQIVCSHIDSHISPICK